MATKSIFTTVEIDTPEGVERLLTALESSKEYSEQAAYEAKRVFANNLIRHMEQCNCTRGDLCKALGIPYSTVSDWCRGLRYPRIEALARLAEYFSVSKADLTEPEKEHRPELVLPAPSEECMKALAVLDDGDWWGYFPDDIPTGLLTELCDAIDTVKKALGVQEDLHMEKEE